MVHMFVVFAITAVAALHDNNIARMHASNVTVGPLLDATEKRLVGATEMAASGLDKEDFNNTDKTIKLVTGPHGEISATAADSSASFIEEEFHTALAAKKAELDQWKAKAEQQGEEIKRQAEEIKLLQTRIHEYAKNKENDESLSETGMVQCSGASSTCRSGAGVFGCKKYSDNVDMDNDADRAAKENECNKHYERGTLGREFYGCLYNKAEKMSGLTDQCLGVNDANYPKQRGMICKWKSIPSTPHYAAELYTSTLKGGKPPEASGTYTCFNDNIFCRWMKTETEASFLFSKFKRCHDEQQDGPATGLSARLPKCNGAAIEVQTADVPQSKPPDMTEYACAFQISDVNNDWVK